MPCSPGMRACHKACRHRSFVTEYQAARENGEQLRDEAVGVYGQHSPEWSAYQPPPITFHDWLVQMTGWSKA